jgi:hypothetical protein
MATTTNFGWETPDDTDLVKDGALAMRTLGNAIDTSLVDLKGGTTGQVLSKTSNTDMDFTWVTSDDANAIQNAIVDAKGDLITATAADTPARLAVGTNGQVLTADSTTATGLKWATTTSTSGLTLITSTSISNTTSLNVNDCFSSTYQNYKIFITTSAAASTALVTMRLRVSSTDASTNYSYVRLICNLNGVSAQVNGVGTDEFFIGEASDTGVSAMEVSVFNPYATDQTALGSVFSGRNPTNPIVQIFSGEHTDATSYTGFTLLSDQNLTANVRVYGLQNS